MPLVKSGNLFCSEISENRVFEFGARYLIRCRNWIKNLKIDSNLWYWILKKLDFFSKVRHFLKIQCQRLESIFQIFDLFLTTNQIGAQNLKKNSILQYFDPFRAMSQVSLWNSVKFDFLKILGKKIWIQPLGKYLWISQVWK